MGYNYNQSSLDALLKSISIENDIRTTHEQYEHNMQILKIAREEYWKLFNTIIDRIQKETDSGITKPDRLTFIGLRTETMETFDILEKAVKEGYKNSLNRLSSEKYCCDDVVSTGDLIKDISKES